MWFSLFCDKSSQFCGTSLSFLQHFTLSFAVHCSLFGVLLYLLLCVSFLLVLQCSAFSHWLCDALLTSLLGFVKHCSLFWHVSLFCIEPFLKQHISLSLAVYHSLFCFAACHFLFHILFALLYLLCLFALSSLHFNELCHSLFFASLSLSHITSLFCFALLSLLCNICS